MRFHWIQDRANQGHFIIYWKRGENNLADYFSKHHSPAHHRRVRSTYLVNLIQTCIKHDLDFTQGCVPQGFPPNPTRHSLGQQAGNPRHTTRSYVMNPVTYLIKRRTASVSTAHKFT